MRMRKKKWAVPELEASPLYIKAPASLKEQWQQAFVRPQPLYLESVSYTHLRYGRKYHW